MWVRVLVGLVALTGVAMARGDNPLISGGRPGAPDPDRMLSHEEMIRLMWEQNGPQGQPIPDHLLERARRRDAAKRQPSETVPLPRN